jgi:hypothetical protein
MNRVVALAAAILISQATHAREPYVDCLPKLPPAPVRAIESQQEYLSLQLDEEAHFFGKVSQAEYKSVLEAAANGGVAQLALIFSSAPYQDGAGAESYASTLFWLLHQVGDTTFASQLAKQPKSIRDRVVGMLDYAAHYDYAPKFPKTSRLAKHLAKCSDA